MDPHQYFSSLSRDEFATLAEKCETTVMYLEKLARKHKRGDFQFKPRLALLLETHTDKKVQRWESMPTEWAFYWPELADSLPRLTKQLSEA